MKKFLLLLVLGVGLIARSSLGMPAANGYVNDFAGVVPSYMHELLENKLSQFTQKTGMEISVVTVTSLDGTSVDDYASKLFEAWGIGKKGKDNGVLFLVAPTEHKVRIEVGYGLEGILNDAKAGRLLRETFVPYAKQDNLPAGIFKTTDALINLLSDPAMAEKVQTKSQGITFGKIVMLLIFLYLFIRHPWIFLFLMSNGRSSGSNSGFGGGGFGGFGGGSSGGGGGSSSW